MSFKKDIIYVFINCYNLEIPLIFVVEDLPEGT